MITVKKIQHWLESLNYKIDEIFSDQKQCNN